MASCSVRNGIITSFWEDTWDFGVLTLLFPELYSFSLNKKISVQKFLQSDIDHLLQLPLSLSASNELAILINNLDDFQLQLNSEDIWSYIWGSNAFSVQKAFSKLIGTTLASPWFKWMWRSYAVRVTKKFFFWLFLRDRINTRGLPGRKNMHLDSYNCVYCDTGQEETIVHLFFQCPFSQRCCRKLNIFWDLSLDPDSMLFTARQNFNSKIFREVLIIGCCAIWCHRTK